MSVLETCIWHASDWIAWVDRSGYAKPDHQPLVSERLAVSFRDPPRDLTVVEKRGRTLLWRRRPGALRRTEVGAVGEAARQRPAVPGYPLEGEVTDPSGRYLPRRFALSAGAATGHPVTVYRAPQGTRFQAAGGVHGRVVFDDGTPGAWAVIEVEVTPPLAGALPFVAQADSRGEFRLALGRLPALTKEAPSTKYPATLRIRASLGAAKAWLEAKTLADPDQLAAVKVKNLTPPAQFKASVALEITPGAVTRLASVGSEDLLLKMT